MKSWKLIFLLFLIAGTAYILTTNIPYQTEEGRIFGTTYRITYKAKKSYAEEIKNTLQAVDNSLSPFNKSSIISKINNNEEVALDNMFTYVYNMAQSVSEATDGAFDITVAPLVNAWGFGFKKGIEPDSATIEEMKAYTGYRKISLKDGKIVKEHPQTMLNCSAIAKGYGCDAVASMLRSKGIPHPRKEDGIWVRSNIGRMLRNPIYVRADETIYEYFIRTGAVIHNPPEDFAGIHGCYLYNKTGRHCIVLAPHEGIVPSDLWLRCRQKSKQGKLYPSVN